MALSFHLTAAIIMRRFRVAFKAFLWHLLGSALVACAAAGIVFGLLYPSPFAQMLGGFELFLLVVSVDVVCGPLLTLVLFNPNKSRTELTLDLSIVGCLQIGALIYGLHTVWIARPVYLAYELDRFRVVTLADLEPIDIPKIPSVIGPPGWTGPVTVGVRVAKADDEDYLTQLQLSLNGQDAAYRTERWRPYAEFRQDVLARSHPLSALYSRHAESSDQIRTVVLSTNIAVDQIRWLPVQSRKGTGWTALIDNKTIAVVGFLNLDSF